MHLKRDFVLRSGHFVPARWNSIHLGQVVEIVLVAVCWVVMHKDTAIPRPIERTGTAVETFTALIKEQIAAFQCHFVSS